MRIVSYPTGDRRSTILCEKETRAMARKRNTEVTSKKAASAAAKVLRNPKASKAAKSAAGSALTQRPDRRKK